MIPVNQMVTESKTNGVYSSINTNQLKKNNHAYIISNSDQPINSAWVQLSTVKGMWIPCLWKMACTAT